MRKYLIALVLVCACNTDDSNVNGLFTGTASSGKLTCIFGTTGDGLVSGTWESENADVTSGELIGHLHSFSNDLHLRATKGRCPGDFEGDFKVKDGVFTARLNGNPKCPEVTLAIDLKKTR